MDTKSILWAPWRMQYVTGDKPTGCFLCQKYEDSHDAENYVVSRGNRCYVILNLFPYNPGQPLCEASSADHVSFRFQRGHEHRTGGGCGGGGARSCARGASLGGRRQL